jgi:hypothetical protein
VDKNRTADSATPKKTRSKKSTAAAAPATASRRPQLPPRLRQNQLPLRQRQLRPFPVLPSASPPHLQPRLPRALPLQRLQPLNRRLRQTALAWCGSTRTPAYITSPARAGMEKLSKGST